MNYETEILNWWNQGSTQLGVLSWEQREKEVCSTCSTCQSVGSLSPQGSMESWSLASEVTVMSFPGRPSCPFIPENASEKAREAEEVVSATQWKVTWCALLFTHKSQSVVFVWGSTCACQKPVLQLMTASALLSNTHLTYPTNNGS